MNKLDGVFNELTIAPTFKDLLHAIMDDRRQHLKNTDFYKYVEKSIRAKCEEFARNLHYKITIQDISRALISNELFKTLGAKFSVEELLYTIKCVTEDLGLEYKDGVISWE